MSLQGQISSTGEQKTTAAKNEEEDLNQLARQTLSGVKPNLLPPEPFPAGFDLSALASTRTSRPPDAPAIGTGKDDTGGRIDLRSLRAPVESVPKAAASMPPPRTLPPRKVGGPRAVLEAAPGALPVQFAQPAPRAPAANDLDALIASRAFAPGSQLADQAANVFALVKRAPAWVWVGAAGIAIGLALGSSGSDASQQTAGAAAASVVSASGAASSAPSLPFGATALPQIAAAPRSRDSYRAAGAPGPRRARDANDARASSSAAPAAAPSAPAPVDPASAEDRTIDSLLDQAIGGRAIPVAAPAPAKPARSGPALPDLPARDAVASVMSGLQPRIRFCAGDRSGVATASVVVKNDGRVSSARINGAPFSRTAAGRCMETVIRGARFPQFGQPTFRMSYPFQL